ncbi:DNA methyltransferase [Pseudomonas aeruginosa]
MLLKLRDSPSRLLTTSSLFQGEQAEIVLHTISRYSLKIYWCHPSFMWSNNASNNAGVTCSIVGCARDGARPSDTYGDESRRRVENIGPYLVPVPDIVVSKRQTPLSQVSRNELWEHCPTTTVNSHSPMTDTEPASVPIRKIRVFSKSP